MPEPAHTPADGDLSTDARGSFGEATTSGSPSEPAAERRVIGRGRWVAGAVAALGVALFAVPFIRTPGPADPNVSGPTCSAKNGDANLDFTLKDVDGADVRLSDFKGKVILLNFWATWCGPCKIEIPEFVEVYKEYRDRGFVILGVLSQDDPPAQDLRDFAREWRMNYPILREHPELDEAFGPLFAIPTSFIIDRQGSICTKRLGPFTKEMLEQEIERLL